MNERHSSLTRRFFSWPSFFRSSRNLQQTLLWSHGSVAAVGLAIFIVTAVSVLWLRSHTLHLITETGPAVQHSMQVLQGLERATSALRGWVTLGQQPLQREWQHTWAADIWPALQQLHTLSPEPASQIILHELTTELYHLEETQWYIQDVAHTQGNQPAQALLNRNIQPIDGTIVEAITTLINIEKTRPPGSDGGKFLLGLMADFRASFLIARSALANTLNLSSHGPTTQLFHEPLEIATQRLLSIQENGNRLTPEGQEVMRWLADQFHRFHRLADQALPLRLKSDRNVALHLLATQSLPLINHVRSLIDQLMAISQAQLQADTSTVTWGSTFSVWISTGLLAIMMVTAVWLSRMHAQRIAGPIIQLSHATRHFASTHHTEQFPVTRDDEIGQLTQSFNAMQRNIEDSEHALKNAQDQLMRQARLATLGQLAGSIAHELRNPLGSIRNALYLIQADLSSPTNESQTFLAIAEEEVHHCNMIITDLLSLARGKDPVKKSVNLEHLITRAFSRAGDSPHIQLDLQFNPNPFLILVDPSQFEQALKNIFINALQAMGEMGDLLILANHKDDGDVLTIHDSGPGITADIRERIFEPLSTNKVKGTGLGLAICQQIIQRHGGTITLLDTETTGATFEIRLPGGDGDVRWEM